MTTQRLYYTDSYLTHFAARVVGHTAVQDKPGVILDQTAFYPTSGGQPHDTGTLTGCRVADVMVQNGDIVHLVDTSTEPDVDLAHPGELPVALSLGATVHGQVDWPRRFDHMQQHTGQHLISQIFAQMYDYETVAVHFGIDESTLDLDTPELSPAQLAAAERAANEMVYQAMPVSAYMIVDSELDDVPLRRPPKVQGQIRIVEIHRWDYSACGGAHCRTTAEIGVVKFLQQERRKYTTRLTFQCGGRAYRDYAQRQALLAEIAGLYSADVRRTPELTANLLTQNARLERQLEELTTQLAGYAATELAAQGLSLGDYTLVTHRFDDRPAEWLKAVAAHLQCRPETITALAGHAEGKTTVVIARGADAPIHAGQMLRTVLGQFGGGGGGRAEFAQGGGVEPEQLDALLAAAMARIRAALEGETAK